MRRTVGTSSHRPEIPRREISLQVDLALEVQQTQRSRVATLRRREREALSDGGEDVWEVVERLKAKELKVERLKAKELEVELKLCLKVEMERRKEFLLARPQWTSSTNSAL